MGRQSVFPFLQSQLSEYLCPTVDRQRGNSTRVTAALSPQSYRTMGRGNMVARLTQGQIHLLAMLVRVVLLIQPVWSPVEDVLDWSAVSVQEPVTRSVWAVYTTGVYVIDHRLLLDQGIVV